MGLANYLITAVCQTFTLIYSTVCRPPSPASINPRTHTHTHTHTLRHTLRITSEFSRKRNFFPPKTHNKKRILKGSG
ncbi:hypothetical protein GGR50DRAFT_684132 [Xylaria sp. CBS 124048]|nr:hypothetical protein GGR50DRAFT_684132 [Xylaria sp. CBS 124048]